MRRYGLGKLGAIDSLAVAVALLLSVSSQSPVRAADPPFNGDLPPSGSGSALLVTNQSVSVADLLGAIDAGGCDARMLAVTEAGQWLLYVPGAPDIVNEAFPDPVASLTPFAVVCDAPSEDGGTAQDAVDVIEQYIADLDAENYAAAYDAWEPGANPQSFEDFVAGYEHTASVSVDIGTPGRIDAGAGQRYIEIPVVIHATLDDGTQQTFEGTYTLHRAADIPGATPEQQMWRISGADIVQTA